VEVKKGSSISFVASAMAVKLTENTGVYFFLLQAKKMLLRDVTAFLPMKKNLLC